MKKYKNVEFDFFKPYYLVTEKDESSKEYLYDFTAFLQHISKTSLLNTKRKIFGDHHMFHKCKYHKETGIWELQILHLREQILPGIADEGGSYELIKLGENQYPAESTTVLYNEKANVLYMQRNIYGTSIRALTGLIQLISPEGILVILKPIMKHASIDKIKDSNKYRKLILTVDSEQISIEERNTKLGKIISTFSEYNGRIVTVSLGFGRKRGTFLNKVDTVQLLREAYEFPGTEKLIAGMSESEDGKFENVDLLDDREKILMKMSYSREAPITHERLYSACFAKLKKK